jgi:hypothetical protein
MNRLVQRLDRAAEALRPPSERPRVVWRDKAGAYLAKIEAIKASGFKGEIITLGWIEALDGAAGGVKDLTSDMTHEQWVDALHEAEAQRLEG